MARVLTIPKLPEFDSSTDGNPFAWIVRTAPQVRAVRQAQALSIRLRREAEARSARIPINPPPKP